MKTICPPPIFLHCAAFCTIGPEDKLGFLLRKVFARLPAGGALLVAERLLNEDGVGPVPANMQSLVTTEGRERSLSEYSALLRAAGFKDVAGKRTGTPLDAIRREVKWIVRTSGS